jgi:hypothetical protein
MQDFENKKTRLTYGLELLTLKHDRDIKQLYTEIEKTQPKSTSFKSDTPTAINEKADKKQTSSNTTNRLAA